MRFIWIVIIIVAISYADEIIEYITDSVDTKKIKQDIVHILEHESEEEKEPDEDIFVDENDTEFKWQ